MSDRCPACSHFWSSHHPVTGCYTGGCGCRGAEPRFDGETYSPEHDSVRLTGQLGAVYLMLQDGTAYTLAELKQHVGGSEAAISARLRDLRKPKFGSHDVRRRRRATVYNASTGRPAGLWEYWMVKP